MACGVERMGPLVQLVPGDFPPEHWMGNGPSMVFLICDLVLSFPQALRSTFRKLSSPCGESKWRGSFIPLKTSQQFHPNFNAPHGPAATHRCVTRCLNSQTTTNEWAGVFPPTISPGPKWVTEWGMRCDGGGINCLFSPPNCSLGASTPTPQKKRDFPSQKGILMAFFHADEDQRKRAFFCPRWIPPSPLLGKYSESLMGTRG